MYTKRFIKKRKKEKHIWHATASATQQPASVHPGGGRASARPSVFDHANVLIVAVVAASTASTGWLLVQSVFLQPS